MKTATQILAAMGALCLLATPAGAYVVDVYTVEDPVQDDWAIAGDYDELGWAPPFPTTQELLSSYSETDYVPCPTEYEDGTNWEVQITNSTALAYRDVYYVADPETDLTNWDEWVGQVGDPDPEKAFKIDAIGENTPLVYETITTNGIWQPGETWAFVIQDYSNTLNLPPAAFGSLGIASFSAGDTMSSGSILVPEPASLSVLVLGSLALIRRHRR